MRQDLSLNRGISSFGSPRIEAVKKEKKMYLGIVIIKKHESYINYL